MWCVRTLSDALGKGDVSDASSGDEAAPETRRWLDTVDRG